MYRDIAPSVGRTPQARVPSPALADDAPGPICSAQTHSPRENSRTAKCSHQRTANHMQSSPRHTHVRSASGRGACHTQPQGPKAQRIHLDENSATHATPQHVRAVQAFARSFADRARGERTARERSGQPLRTVADAAAHAKLTTQTQSKPRAGTALVDASGTVKTAVPLAERRGELAQQRPKSGDGFAVRTVRSRVRHQGRSRKSRSGTRQAKPGQ